MEIHVRELQNAVEDVADLRAELSRNLDQSRALLNISEVPVVMASTPVMVPEAEDRRDEAEISVLLDRLTIAAAQGDDAAWDSTLQESLRPRGRRRGHRISSLSDMSLGGVAEQDNNSSLRPPPTSAPPTNPPPSPSPPPSPGSDAVSDNDPDPQEDGGAEQQGPSEVQRGWLVRITEAQTFDEFEAVVGEWTATLRTNTNREAGAGPAQVRAGRGGLGNLGNGRRRGPRGGARGGRVAERPCGRPVPATYDPVMARDIQKLFRTNKRKAVHQILGGGNQFCTVDGRVVEDHFRGVFSAGDYSVGEAPRVVGDVMPMDGRDYQDDEVLKEITTDEVVARLGRVSNTAPGPDLVPYWAIKKGDPGAYVLTAIFNRCLEGSRTPAAWKVANTVLIYKKGDPNDIDNWRPLTLASCVSKLYTGILADRVGGWARRAGRISWPQKGFMEFEGCFEHNFLVQSIIEDARRNGKQAIITWLDLSNAFGSVPHAFLEHALQRHGAPNKLITTVMELYNNAATRIRTKEGYSDLVPLAAGVKQGDPLSPILFNLAMEPVIRSASQAAPRCGYHLHGQKYSIVAYADDLALISANEPQMRELLDLVHEVATWAGLKFKPSKCASLHVDCTRRRVVLPTVFMIDGAPIKALQDGEEYCHLGVPTGFNISQTPAQDISQMRDDIHTIDQSLLAPWQKLEAVRVFILPRLDFIMRAARIAKGPLTKFDNELKRLAKKWLNLPQRASAEIVYLGAAEGGAGLLPLADLLDISSVVHAFRLITCRDPVVKSLARECLRAVVRRKLGRPPSPENIADYLSGRLDGEFGRDGGDIASTWTDARKAASRLRQKIGVSWRFSQDLDEFQVHIPTPGIGNEYLIVPEDARKALLVRLKNALRAGLRRSLCRKPDQGKVIDVSCRSQVSNHFIMAGKYTRFADWRFIFRARLGTVPLNGCKRWGEGDKRCRRCNEPLETLPHVLNHCRPHSAAWKGRHDAVLHRLARAVPKKCGAIRIDQRVPGVAGDLRPDLVVINERERRINIVDVTVPFESRYGALQEARRLKIEKYSEMANSLRLQGYQVALGALVIGSLGSWDNANERVIKTLGISPRYARTLRALMVSDTIRWSRDIYVTHVTGQRQWS